MTQDCLLQFFPFNFIEAETPKTNKIATTPGIYSSWRRQMKATRHETNKDASNPNAVGDSFFISLQFSFVKRRPKKGRKKEKNVDKYGPMNPQRKADAELAIKSNPNFAFTFHTPRRIYCQ
jgi:hypothetical protein